MSISHCISTTPGGSTKPCVPIRITDIAISEKSTAVYGKSANAGIIVSLTAGGRNVEGLSVSSVARENTTPGRGWCGRPFLDCVCEIAAVSPGASALCECGESTLAFWIEEKVIHREISCRSGVFKHRVVPSCHICRSWSRSNHQTQPDKTSHTNSTRNIAAHPINMLTSVLPFSVCTHRYHLPPSPVPHL